MKITLKSQGIEVWSAKVYEDVRRLLDQTHPDLIFTAMTFFDGTWRDIIHLSEEAWAATCAIVVGRQKDVRLYFSALDYGAFALVFPPYETDVISRVIQTAENSVRHRREIQALRVVA